jgi:flagellar biosynthesis anti-sigma factor FlgM
MRISGKSSSVGSTQSVQGAKASSAPAPTSAPTSAVSTSLVDALQVSDASRLVAVAQVALAAVPDVRTEKVEALKARLDSDSYHPDGEAVADGLIREHIPAGS